MVKPAFDDVFAALGAIAEFALVNAGEGSGYAGTMGGTAALGGLGHGLLLERVHTAEPSHGLLVERDGFLTFGAKRILGIERGKILRKPCAIGFNFGR